MKTELIKATGQLVGNQVEFTDRCPVCDLQTIIVFTRSMKLRSEASCSHYLSYRLEKGSGVFFSFAKDQA